MYLNQLDTFYAVITTISSCVCILYVLTIIDYCVVSDQRITANIGDK